MMATDQITWLMQNKKLYKVTPEMMAFATLKQLLSESPLSLHKDTIRMLLESLKSVSKWTNKFEVTT